FLKLDVEGAELRLLKGARKSLERFEPFILFEVNEGALQLQGASGDEIFKFLDSLSYRLYLFDPETGLPAPCSEGRFSENVLAVPPTRELPSNVFMNIPQWRTEASNNRLFAIDVAPAKQ